MVEGTWTPNRSDELATGSSTVPQETVRLEGATAAASYVPAFFAGAALEALSALLRRSEPDWVPRRVPLFFYIEPKEVPGYRMLDGDPITRAVSLPMDVAICGLESSSNIAWRRDRGPARDLSRTNFSVPKLPSSPRPRPSGRHALEDLSRSTGLSHEALGVLIGASRRSVYNWLHGRAISPRFEARVLRLRSTLRPLAESRAPGEIATWLQAGPTPPAGLLREERWEDVEALVQQELKPRVLEPMPTDPEDGAPEAYSAATRRAVLASLRTSPSVQPRRRPNWRPREITGTLAPAEDEAE